MSSFRIIFKFVIPSHAREQFMKKRMEYMQKRILSEVAPFAFIFIMAQFNPINNIMVVISKSFEGFGF